MSLCKDVNIDLALRKEHRPRLFEEKELRRIFSIREWK
jgi:hypothetical protein